MDGTSLTVVDAGVDYFTVSLVYHTQENITLPRKSTGDLVNIEIDVLAKYAERFAEAGEALPADTRELASRVGLTLERLPNGGKETAMPLATVAESLEELRSGRFVIVVDDEQRENEGDLVIAAEHTTPEAINFMAREGRGLICLAMTAERLDSLGIPLMVPPGRNTSPYGTAYTISVEARQGITTGISAHDRATTVRVMADPATRPEDFAMPGHVFPLRAREGGCWSGRVTRRLPSTSRGWPACSPQPSSARLWPRTARWRAYRNSSASPRSTA